MVLCMLVSQIMEVGHACIPNNRSLTYETYIYFVILSLVVFMDCLKDDAHFRWILQTFHAISSLKTVHLRGRLLIQTHYFGSETDTWHDTPLRHILTLRQTHLLVSHYIFLLWSKRLSCQCLLRHVILTQLHCSDQTWCLIQIHTYMCYPILNQKTDMTVSLVVYP